MLPSLNPPANHLNTCLILGRSLSLRHSNHSCVIYSCPSGEHKECNLANPIRRQNQSDRPRCWEIFAWLWTCVLAGKGSDVSLNSVGNPHGLFPLLFTWALGNARAPKPQVLSLSAWQHETHQDCFEKKIGTDGQCWIAMVVKGQLSTRALPAFSASVILGDLNCMEYVSQALSHI